MLVLYGTISLNSTQDNSSTSTKSKYGAALYKNSIIVIIIVVIIIVVINIFRSLVPCCTSSFPFPPEKIPIQFSISLLHVSLPWGQCDIHLVNKVLLNGFILSYRHGQLHVHHIKHRIILVHADNANTGR